MRLYAHLQGFDPERCTTFIKNIYIYSYHFLSGIIMSIFGYFLPIKNDINFLLALFIIDVFFGYLADKKKGGKFSAKKIWNTTIPRILMSIAIIVLLFAWDDVHNQNTVATYNIISYFISGVLLVSIFQNMFSVSKWKVFLKISDFIKKKTKTETGLDV